MPNYLAGTDKDQCEKDLEDLEKKGIFLPKLLFFVLDCLAGLPLFFPKTANIVLLVQPKKRAATKLKTARN